MASTPPADDLDPPAADPAPDPAPKPDPKASDPPAADPKPDPVPKDPPADDWRTNLAAGDEKALAFLGRFASPKAFVEAAKKANDDNKARLKPLSDDPTEAELKAYRTAMGVPEKPEGYLEKLSGGLVVGEDDRPIVDKFLAAMHEKHAPAAVTDAALQAYYKIVEEQDAAIAESVAQAKQATEEELRTEWGADYRRNLTATEGFLGSLPQEVQDAFANGFDGKGVPLKTNANVYKWLAQLALEANPLATVVPGASDQPSAIADEIAAIEKRMRTDRPGYNADTKMQARYLQLLGARDKMKGSSSASEQG